MHLALIDRPLVTHNLISTQKSPVPLLKFQMTPRQNHNGPGSKRKPDILFLSLKSPGKWIPSRFPNRAPIEREARLQGILHVSQKPGLLGSLVKEPSLKVPLMESLEERCPTTRTHLHLSIKVPSIWAPTPRVAGSPQLTCPESIQLFWISPELVTWPSNPPPIFRVSIILLRKHTSFSENHIENLNHLGKEGTTLKTTFSTDLLPLYIHKSQALEGDYIRPLSNVLSLQFDRH